MPAGFTPEEREACFEDVAEFLDDLRPESHLRSQLDYRYKLDGLSVLLYEVRPAWDAPGTVLETPFAKITYVRTRDSWKLFWRRSNGAWKAYEPAEFPSLEDTLAVVRWNETGCFLG